MIIEKIAISLNNDNFFTNNHILAISFANSQFARIAHTTGSKPKMLEKRIILR